MWIVQIVVLCVAWSACVLGKCAHGKLPCFGCCCNKNGSLVDCSFPPHKWTYIPRLPDNVTNLFFRHQILPNVTLNTFRNISKLRVHFLDLTDNGINTISADAFRDLQYLEILKLNHNTNISLPTLQEALGSISKHCFKKLYLENITIKETTGMFQKMNDSSVEKISLSNNRMKFLQLKSFENLENLEHLDVSKNYLKRLQSENFTLRALKYLNLEYNEIARTLPAFCPFHQGDTLYPNLQRLNLACNFISKLPPEHWNCLDKLKDISLRENVIRELDGNVFSGLKSLHKLQLSRMLGNMKRIHSEAFASQSLRELQFHGNNIHFHGIQNAKKLFKKCEGLTSLDLSKNDFANVNNTILVDMLSPLKHLEKLTLVKMKLVNIPENLLQHFPNISILNLDGNGIQTFGLSFQNVTTLQKLSCQGNNLRIVHPSSFPITFLKTLRYLNLADNPFECTCDLLAFRQWMGNSGKIGNVTLYNWPWRYWCFSPPSMNKKQLSDFIPTAESCSNSNPMLIAYVTIGSFLVVTIVFTTLIHRNIWYIRFWIYKIKRTRNTRTSAPGEESPLLSNDHLQYDAYVIYNDEDRAFVHGDLRLFLEEKHQYRLHIWHRNADFGSKLEVMANAIYASNNVIAVVSRNFFNDRWCNFQIDVAIDRQLSLGRSYVLFLLMEDLNYESLSSYWCVMLTKRRTAKWCSEDNSIKKTVLEEQIKEHLSPCLKNLHTARRNIQLNLSNKSTLGTAVN